MYFTDSNFWKIKRSCQNVTFLLIWKLLKFGEYSVDLLVRKVWCGCTLQTRIWDYFKDPSFFEKNASFCHNISFFLIWKLLQRQSLVNTVWNCWYTKYDMDVLNRPEYCTILRTQVLSLFWFESCYRYKVWWVQHGIICIQGII